MMKKLIRRLFSGALAAALRALGRDGPGPSVHEGFF